MTMTFEAVERSPAAGPASADRDVIQAVRDAFVSADAAGDSERMARLLAEDIVVLHPHCGVMEGKDAVRTFMGRVLGEVHAAFDKQASYTTIELTVSGDLAYERGAFLQRLTPKTGGPVVRDDGMYLWIYVRRDGKWQIARIAGTFTTSEEPIDGQTEERC
jgi:uncharacterized protein (TIGR02246 family)